MGGEKEFVVSAREELGEGNVKEYIVCSCWKMKIVLENGNRTSGWL